MVKREFLANDIFMSGIAAEDPNFFMGGSVVGLTGPQDVNDLAATTSKIGVRTTDSGMEFMALDIDANQSVIDEVRRLNKDLKPVINNTVHAFAHLDGRTDYGKVWEEGAAEFLGGGSKSTSGR